MNISPESEDTEHQYPLRGRLIPDSLSGAAAKTLQITHALKFAGTRDCGTIDGEGKKSISMAF
jgi:hypothetical protein